MATRGNTALESRPLPKAECVPAVPRPAAALRTDWDLRMAAEVGVVVGALESEGCYLGASGEVVVGLLGVMGTMADSGSWSCWGTLCVGIE